MENSATLHKHSQSHILPKDVSDIYEEIKSRIIRRDLMPGVKINQIQLADELGVSRTPVINALHMLTIGGLVDNIPNRGFFMCIAPHCRTLWNCSSCVRRCRNGSGSQCSTTC